MWLNMAGTGHNLVWWHPWPADVTSELVLSTNPHGGISNSDLKLVYLVLQEATLLEAVLKASTAAPRSGSDNTPTVSWRTHEALMINLVVADLLHIRALHSRKFFLGPFIFYHLVQENYIADDAFHLFHLSDTAFLTHVYVAHPQLYGSW